MDPKVVLDLLVSLDDDILHNVIGELLQSKPELAPGLVNFACPELTYAPAKAVTQRRCNGVVLKVNKDGMSSIRCPELRTVFECDVCVAPEHIVGFSEGQPVSFAVTLNEQSEPQAIDVQHDPPNLPAFMNPDAHAVVPAGSSMGTPHAPAPNAGVVVPRRVYSTPGGTMRMEQQGAGMGAMSTAMGAMSTAMGASMGASMGAGMGAGMGAMAMGAMAMGGGMGAGMGTGSAPSADGMKKVGSRDVPAGYVEELGEFYGIVKSYDTGKGFGFITCKPLKDQYYCDVYVHGDNLQGFEAGSEVKFEAYLYNGKLQGKEVQDATGQVGPGGGLPEELGIFIGEFKVFHFDRGFGFIGCDQLRAQGYLGDAFVHHSQRGEFQPGDTVAFTAVANDGKLLAKDLQDPQAVLAGDVEKGMAVLDHMQVMQSLPGPKSKKVSLY